jgi:Pyruvate/2-oxoacid:ferredoxin oxidoreductase delta subunit
VPVLKVPYLDRTRCRKVVDCKAAKHCKHGAFVVQGVCEEEPGTACDFPRVDLERCKSCGECEHACGERAVKMV